MHTHFSGVGEWGGISFDERLRRAKEGSGEEGARSKLPQIEEYVAFISGEIQKPKTLIAGLLDAESRLVFAGGSKTFKTWSMMDMAVSLAGGAEWWGFQCAPTRVLYVNFELKRYYARERLAAIQEARGARIGNDYFHLWNLRGFDPGRERFKGEVIARMRENEIGALFIDPFYQLLGAADERISAELMPILRLFEEINRESDASIITAAHFTKGNQAAKDPLDRISGGGSLNRHPDSLITLTRHNEPNAFTVDFIIRDFVPVAPFVVKWEHPLLERAPDLDPENIKKAGQGNRAQYGEEDILEVLQEFDDELSRTELEQKVQARTGMSHGTFFRLFKALERSGGIFQSKSTECWNVKSH
jgi:AAA domain-containing protein